MKRNNTQSESGPSSRLGKLRRSKRSEDDGHEGGFVIKHGIRSKLLVGILVPVIIILLLTAVLIVRQSSKTVTEMMRKDLDTSTAVAAERIDAYFKEFFGATKGLASSTQIKTLLKDKEISSVKDSPLWDGVFNELSETQKDYSKSFRRMDYQFFHRGTCTER